MEIKAKFKGRDGSVGYRNGANYRLVFAADAQGIRLYDTARPASSVVMYSSLKSFLNNWQIFA